MDKVKSELQKTIIEGLDLGKEISDEALLDAIDQELLESSKDNYMSMQDKLRLRKDIFNSIRRLDILSELIEDSSITEIMVNGANQIFIERAGALHPYDSCFDTRQKLEDVVQQMVAQSNRIINEANPIVDSRLSDGSRVNIVLPPVAINGPVVITYHIQTK